MDASKHANETEHRSINITWEQLFTVSTQKHGSLLSLHRHTNTSAISTNPIFTVLHLYH